MNGLLGVCHFKNESIPSGSSADTALTARKLKKEIMTIQELLEYCQRYEISLNTHIALRSKDDYLLVPYQIHLGDAYFGNCEDGSKLVQEIAPRDPDGDIMWDNVPHFLILDTGRG